MNFQLITLVALLVFTIAGIIRAIVQPMVRNLFRLGAIPVAFLLSLLLQVVGLYTAISTPITRLIRFSGALETLMDESPDAQAMLNATVAAAIGSILFVLFFILFLVILRLTVVKLLTRVVMGKSSPAETSDTDEKKPTSAWEKPWMIAVSGVTGLISGFLLLAVVLMPVFFIMDLAVSGASAVRSNNDLDSPVQREVAVIDHSFVVPFEQSAAVAVYRTVKLDRLMCSCASVGSTFRTASGETVRGTDTIHTALSKGLHAWILLESATGSDAELSDDLTSLASDPVISGILTDVVLAEAKSFAETGSGKLLKNDPTEDGLFVSIRDTLVSSYVDAEKETVANDFVVLGKSTSPLCDTDFFNRVLAADTRSEALSDLLNSEEILDPTVRKLSQLSVIDALVEEVFHYEIDSIGKVLSIPENNTVAYRLLMKRMVTAVNDRSEGVYDPAAVEQFILTCADEGISVTEFKSKYKNDESKTALYENWDRFNRSFEAIRKTIVLTGDDSVDTIPWYLTTDGTVCILDFTTRVYSVGMIDKYSSGVAPLCQYLAECAVSSIYRASGEDTGFDVTEETVRAWLGNYSDWVTARAPSESVIGKTKELAAKYALSEKYDSTAATVADISDSADFSLITDENREDTMVQLIQVVIHVNDIYNALEAARATGSGDTMTVLINHLSDLGEAMDALYNTEATEKLPKVFLSGMLQNETFNKYLTASIISDLTNSVEAGDTTYTSFMLSLQSLLQIAEQ